MELSGLNLRLFSLINGLNHPALDLFFSALTSLGHGLILLPLLLLLFRYRKEQIVPLLAAFLMSGFVVQVLKALFNAPRPLAVLDNVHVVGEALRTASFPSGHTATAMALCTVLSAGRGRGMKLFLFSLALGVGYSRIYVGAHFPLDVLAGAVAGLLSGYGALKYGSFFREYRKELAVLLLVPAAVFFFRLGNFPFFVLDEAKNAEAAREMLERSDYLIPTFNYALRTDKPPLQYWFFIGAYKLFGVTEFSARIGSALAGLAVSLMTYLFARRVLGREQALLASLIFSTSMYSFLLFRMAVPDPFLIFFSTAALFAFYRGYAGGGSRYYLLFYTALGLAVLTKGPVGFLLPFAVAVAFVFCDALLNQAEAGLSGALSAGFRALRIFFGARHLAGCLIVAAISVPWYVIASVKTGGAYTSGFLLHHNLARFTKPFEGHRGPFFITLPFLLLGFFPWSFYMLQTAAASYRQRRNPAVLFLSLWVLLHVVFYSAAATKLPHYLVPTYPALAILTALTLSGEPSRRKVSSALIALCGLGLSVGLLIAGRKFVPDLPPWYAAVGLPFLVGGAAAVIREEKLTPILSVAMAVFILSISGLLMPLTIRYFIPAKIAAVISAEAGSAAGSADALYSYKYYDAAFEFYTKRKVNRIDSLDEAPEGAVLVSTEEDIAKAGGDASRRLFSEKDVLKNRTVIVMRKGLQ